VDTILLYGDTIRYPSVRHEVPLAIIDPLLFVSRGRCGDGGSRRRSFRGICRWRSPTVCATPARPSSSRSSPGSRASTASAASASRNSC